MSNSNIVVEWLRSLNLGEYAESFLDNGYDDLEICKQVGDPDLDAIGVFNATHRSRLLQSVRTLREEGAASVYFTLEESQAILEESHATQESPKKEIAETTRESPRFLDEYEEGKAELVRVPRIQLKHLLRERLNQDCIRLSSQPYSTANGERGYLEGLGSRYAEIFNTHYSDVLYHLEDLRQREWAELSPRFRVLPVPSVPHGQQSLSRQNGLTTSVSQPIYVPGKYSPSSCLSDREEDEIYGFTNYPVYGKVNGGAARPSPTHQPHQINKHNYQNWLSPRSAYFYEFPPSERPGKKRTSLIRLLRHLKTNRKEKNSSRTNQRVSTPEDGQSTAPLPQDYDKMRLLQKASRVAANTFEETIHRLKVQEAMKKKEKIDRDHEEFLRDIRAGVMVGGRGDDTYMYDEDMARLGHHWYDEPPYESDPEDFLMGDNPALHNTRLCFTMGTRGDQLGAESEVISLRSAGDISLPPQRAILVRPSSRSRSQSHQNRESGDYAASDVNSICSRLSSLSMETSRSEHLEMDVYQRLRSYNGVDPPSPAHSSDYADEELIALQPSCSGSSTTHRMRSLKCDPNGLSGKSLGRRHHHHHHHHHHHVHHRHKAHHHSSAESLPSASSTQALMSGIDDYSPQGQIVPLARALVDSNPYDKDSLRFKKGDIIEVISMSGSGLWRGRVHNRVGHFKFTNVELLNVDDGCTSRRAPSSQSSQGATNRPRTLEQMLEAIHMEEHMSLFVLNGYEDLESFCEIREEDLDYLGLTDPEHRAKILAAVQVLQEFEQVEEEWNGVEPIQTKEANNLSQQITQQNSSEKTDEAFLPNIPVTSDPPPTPAPECNPSVQISKGGSEKSSDSGVSSSSGSSGRLTSGNGSARPSRGRPPPPPKPSPSYVNQLPQTTPD